MTSETQRGGESRIFELEPGRNCWRIARAHRAALIVDGCDYFRLVRQAMLKAKKQIFLIGWDLDTRIALDRPAGKGDPPVHLGPFLSWLVKHKPGLKIYILAWGAMAYSVLGRAGGAGGGGEQQGGESKVTQVTSPSEQAIGTAAARDTFRVA